MDDRERGELLGLLISSRASLDAAITALRSSEPTPETPCPHDVLRNIQAFGDDETPVQICGRCGELVGQGA